MITYQAQGKLLLTGEYFVLDGAISLAVPTKLGQSLSLKQNETSSNELLWNSKDFNGNTWLEGVWDADKSVWNSINQPEKAAYLSQLLTFASRELNLDLGGFSVETKLDFPSDWGLGSSSTLVSLLSQWWKCDAYELLSNSFGGSGYDIACATAKSPILYQLNDGIPKIESAPFKSAYEKQMYFVHLGKKQDSREGIRHYRKLGKEKLEWIPEISDITRKLLRCDDFDELLYLIMLHETIVSRALGLEKVKDKYFDDFPGAIKSLGAWGGDFVWVVSDEAETDIRAYFKHHGLENVISYGEMVF